MDPTLIYKFNKPSQDLEDYIESFWMLYNQSGKEKEVIVLPDGRIDLFLSRSTAEPFQLTLLGIGTQPEQNTIAPGALTFAISFKLLAAEYVFHDTFSKLLDHGKNLSPDFWDFNSNDLNDFDLFCGKASRKIMSLLPKEIDRRKQKLFKLIYDSAGSIPVKELSEKVFWSSRQINRYFNQQYGISLKAYCGILRFRASFQHIKEGKLFPEENFTDQSHFIKEIKKLSGVLPKELKLNQNDRFIQFSTLAKK